MTKTIQPECSVCGDEMTLTLDENGTIPDNVYYTELELPVEDTGEYVDTGHGVACNEDEWELHTEVPAEEADEWDTFYPVTEWTGEYKEVEHWECPECNPNEEQ